MKRLWLVIALTLGAVADADTPPANIPVCRQQEPPLVSRRLDDLDRRFQPKAFELIARCCEQGVPVMIVDTLRTPQEQARNIARGVSWTRNSKHLPQLPSGLSLAIDIVPYRQFTLHGTAKLEWDGEDPAWQTIGEISQNLGLRWGGNWTKKDMGHIEWVEE